MGRVILIFGLALVVLGFLISTTMNMHSEMKGLKAENQLLTQEIAQLRSSFDASVQEREALRKENKDLHNQVARLEQVYAAENKARLKAESDASILKGTLTNMQTQVTSLAICPSPAPKALRPEAILLGSSITPLGVGFVAVVVAAGFGVVVMGRDRRNQKRKV